MSFNTSLYLHTLCRWTSFKNSAFSLAQISFSRLRCFEIFSILLLARQQRAVQCTVQPPQPSRPPPTERCLAGRGWIHYQADCLFFLKNPFLPPSSKSCMAAVLGSEELKKCRTRFGRPWRGRSGGAGEEHPPWDAPHPRHHPGNPGRIIASLAKKTE